MTDEQEREKFIFPFATYRGSFSPQQLAFNANLQEFAQRVALLCSLETNGKISAEDTYKQIKALWKLLKTSKKELLDNSTTGEEPPELPED
jgi:hypothetical protein